MVTHQGATQKRNLNFVHIPKTGGSSIVQTGIDHNISWGDCLFQYSWPGRYCPTKPAEEWPIDKQQMGRVWWHLPIQHLPKDKPNPYENYDLFAVVRNPYDRAISEFYYRCKIFPRQCRGHDGPQGATVLNNYITAALKVVLRATPGSPEYFHHWGHWIPQYDFFFDHNINNDDNNNHSKPQQQMMVQHLLHNEYLNKEFDALVQAYGLHNMTLPKERKKSRADTTTNGAGAQLTVANLTLETIKLIEVVYQKDFDIGNYPMLSGSLERHYLHENEYEYTKQGKQQQEFNTEKNAAVQQRRQRQRRLWLRREEHH